MSFQISAVGKSTFARLLQSACPDWEVVAEPVSKWQNIESGTSKVSTVPDLYIFVQQTSKEANQRSWPSPLVSLTGDRHARPDNSQQPIANDVPGPSALVVHVSDIFLYEPAEDAAAASSSSPAQLRGNTCPGVRTLSLQRQVSESQQGRGTPVLGPLIRRSPHMDDTVLMSSLPKLFQPEWGREL